MIGRVPDGWRVEKVKNIVKIKKGKKVDIFENYEDGLFNYIDISVLRTKKYKYTNDNQIMATDKDILIVWDGANSGYSSFGLNGAVGSTLAKLTLCNENILHTYFGKFIFSKFDYLNATSYGATIPHLQRQMLEDINVPIPPLPQQEKIVRVLDLSAALVEKQQTLLTKYDLFLKSKFIEMFGDPISNPMGWEVEKLGNCIKIMGGAAFKSADYVKNGIPLVKIGTINKGYLDIQNLSYLPTDMLSQYERYILKPNDLLLTLTGTAGKDDYGNPFILNSIFEIYFLNQRVAKIEPHKQLNKVFLYNFIKDKNIKGQLIGMDRGVRQGNISNKDIEGLIIYLPPIDLQIKFAQIVEKVEEIKRQESQKLSHLQTLHNSLMDRAFKGEIA